MIESRLSMYPQRAREELLQLLRTDVEPDQTEFGYVDVLGERDAVGTRPGQRVFRSRWLAAIYVRLWRPIVIRCFFGVPLSATAERRLTMSMLSVSHGERIIDVGCGPGNYTRYLAAAAGDGLVVGTDASAAMLAAAARRGGGSNLAYLRADAGALPFEDAVFDGVCSVGVVHMLEEPEKAIAEMARVLAPGGRLVIFVSYTRKESLRRRGTLKVFGRDELTGELEALGLEDIEQRVMRRAQFVAARKPVR